MNGYVATGSDVVITVFLWFFCASLISSIYIYKSWVPGTLRSKRIKKIVSRTINSRTSEDQTLTSLLERYDWWI
jgi:hypothetical protein